MRFIASLASAKQILSTKRLPSPYQADTSPSPSTAVAHCHGEVKQAQLCPDDLEGRGCPSFEQTKSDRFPSTTVQYHRFSQVALTRSDEGLGQLLPAANRPSVTLRLEKCLCWNPRPSWMFNPPLAMATLNVPDLTGSNEERIA